MVPPTPKRMVWRGREPEKNNCSEGLEQGAASHPPDHHYSFLFHLVWEAHSTSTNVSPSPYLMRGTCFAACVVFLV